MREVNNELENVEENTKATSSKKGKNTNSAKDRKKIKRKFYKNIHTLIQIQ